MKKHLFIASTLMLTILCVNAQDTNTRNNQKAGANSKNTRTNQKNAANRSAQAGTDTTMGATSSTTGQWDTTSTMTSTGRYAAMGARPGSLHRKDMKFVMMANSSNMMELELSRLAEQKATNPAVKDFASMMVQHHTKAAEEMKQLLSSKGAMIPDSAMLSRHRSRIENLQNLEGAEFDKAYMRIMVDAHEEDLDEYEDETTDARDADIRAFVTRMMPTLQTHYTRAREIRKQL